jgi:DNA-binding CsgD family transcriptional regulator
MNPSKAATERNGRLLRTLELLFNITTSELVPALQQAAQAIADVLQIDKADLFLYREENNSLEALGVSDTPVGRLQIAVGMDRLQLVNKGPTVEVFQTGVPFVTGHADQVPGELPGIIEGMGIRSELLTPIDVDGVRRGVLSILSTDEEAFVPEEDLPFAEATARWIGTLILRTERFEEQVQQAHDLGMRECIYQLLGFLTPLQRKIAELIADGQTTEEIAQRLRITPNAVSNHVRNMRSRISALRRAQIARWLENERALLEMPENGEGEEYSEGEDYEELEEE